MVNEGATGPRINPFKAMYWEQFGGGPSEEDLRKMDPAGRIEGNAAPKKNRKKAD
jgi:arylsulfatase